ncbi:MAG: pyrroline-5-carboxylate reductase [Alphaproteobacteria bacterium]|nr:pyrroline-5-carboxylate reductase [Alphaproteobacteria bacterium]
MTQINLDTIRILFVGCGNMGSAILSSWLEHGVNPDNVSIRVNTQQSADGLTQRFGVTASPLQTYNNHDIVVLAVKPQMLDSVLAQHWADAPATPLYISIAAGKTLEYFQRMLGAHHRIIRAMPNTPSLVGEGVTTLVAGDSANIKDQSLATQLFETCGAAIWLDNEAQLAIATAIAGSGPAYVYHFAECLYVTAQKMGLPDDTALALVRGTLSGSVALANAQGWDDIAQLRQNVTSKGGVTQAALEVLMTDMPNLITRALQANIARSKELE